MSKMEQVEARKSKPARDKRDKRGRLLPGNTANPNGRPVLSEEQKLEKKIEKKAIKELVSEYKESLSEVLPELSPVLKKRALEGDIQAIKELHEVVEVKSKEAAGVAVQINLTQIINKVNEVLDGGSTEKS